MSHFEAVWEFIGKKHFSAELAWKVRRELFACISAAPLLHTYLGASISQVATASDASMTGGAVRISRHLTTEGKDYLHTAINAVADRAEIPVLVKSLFNGIGGSFRCYDILGVSPAGLVSFEIHRPANRVSGRRWPHSLQYGDVRDFNEKLLFDLLLKFPPVQEVHLWSGFPCVDLSSAKAGRKGLQGDQSSLFYEVVRILKMLTRHCVPLITVKYVTENVASMPKEDLTEISEELGETPYHLNCSDAVAMNRPRLCWTSESLENAVEGLTLTQEQYWVRLEALNPSPNCQYHPTTSLCFETFN